MKTIALTLGDPRGVGPEILTKTIPYLLKFRKKRIRFLIIGSRTWYNKLPANLKRLVISIEHKDLIDAIMANTLKANLFYLDVDRQSKGINYLDWAPSRAIEIAHSLCMKKLCSALVTGPIDKESLNRAKYKYAGHTDMLAKLNSLKTSDVTMVLASNKMKVALVTDHIPLKQVSRALNARDILSTIVRLNLLLKSNYGVIRPNIAVLGLNPHAGDGGLFGDEEIKLIRPAIKAASKRGIKAVGPFAADGFFSCWKSRHEKRIDGIVAMYHDQGLIPLKLSAFSSAINITCGLPYVRTSVDHGVAYDIVGKNLADPSSLKLAVDHAVKFIKSYESK